MTRTPKVTINPDAPTPSQQIVAAAAAEVTVQDTRGRTLILRKPSLLAQFRLIEAMGPEAAANDVYRTMCLPLLCLVSIDGDAIYAPATKAQLEALIQRVDSEGFVAIQQGSVQFEAAEPGLDAAKN